MFMDKTMTRKQKIKKDQTLRCIMIQLMYVTKQDQNKVKVTAVKLN